MKNCQFIRIFLFNVVTTFTDSRRVVVLRKEMIFQVLSVFWLHMVASSRKQLCC